ncbi:MAG TPA: hypothetical protein VMM59_10690 [Thermohalobaculum sp.]|nr:hypothetical protein [Thermohalobaculum sp.]
MSDVLQLAARYRSRLKAELAKIDEFLRMAEELARGGDLEGRMPFSGNREAKPAEIEGKARPVEAEAKAKPAESKPAEAKAPEGDAPKTPFDRIRAAGG